MLWKWCLSILMELCIETIILKAKSTHESLPVFTLTQNIVDFNSTAQFSVLFGSVLFVWFGRSADFFLLAQWNNEFIPLKRQNKDAGLRGSKVIAQFRSGPVSLFFYTFFHSTITILSLKNNKNTFCEGGLSQ